VRCFVVAGFLLTSASRGPSAIAEFLVLYHQLFVNMAITKEDKTLVKNLFTLEYYNAKRVSWQRWKVDDVCKLVQKLRVTGSVDRRFGSSGLRMSMHC